MPASSRSQSLTLWGSQDRATELAGMVREGKRRRKEEVEGSSITTADLILEAVELWKKRRGRRRRRKEEPAGARYFLKRLQIVLQFPSKNIFFLPL